MAIITMGRVDVAASADFKEISASQDNVYAAADHLPHRFRDSTNVPVRVNEFHDKILSLDIAKGSESPLEGNGEWRRPEILRNHTQSQRLRGLLRSCHDWPNCRATYETKELASLHARPHARRPHPIGLNECLVGIKPPSHGSMS
jgi:hypothetical protein